jgi:DNA-binding response OmpR family regulator
MLEFLRTGLREKGHSIVTARTAAEGRRLVDEHTLDAVVLDIGLPDHSGYTIAHYLQNRSGRPAIVMLTAFNQEDSVVYGLDAGADDYITKPFSFAELIARIGSAARRARMAAVNDFCFGPFQLDTIRRQLLCNRNNVHITPSEYLLLHVLVLNRGGIVSRRQLMKAVWGTTAISNGKLDGLVNTLRDKFNPEYAGMISTIRGSGYSLLEEIEPQERG